MWDSLYDESNQPTYEDIKAFVGSELWDELCVFIEKKYKILPNMEYSKCSAQKGWNVKYKKKGKSICTLYPMKGYFIVLIVIGEKQQTETEIAIPSCTTYIQELYHKTRFLCGGRWLMIEVHDIPIFEDVCKLAQIRANDSSIL